MIEFAALADAWSCPGHRTTRGVEMPPFRSDSLGYLLQGADPLEGIPVVSTDSAECDRARGDGFILKEG